MTVTAYEKGKKFEFHVNGVYTALLCPHCNATHVRTFGYTPSVMPLIYVHLDMPLTNATHAHKFGYAPL
jgi:hypothetical protein